MKIAIAALVGLMCLGWCTMETNRGSNEIWACKNQGGQWIKHRCLD